MHGLLGLSYFIDHVAFQKKTSWTVFGTNVQVELILNPTYTYTVAKGTQTNNHHKKNHPFFPLQSTKTFLTQPALVHVFKKDLFLAVENPVYKQNGDNLPIFYVFWTKRHYCSMCYNNMHVCTYYGTYSVTTVCITNRRQKRWKRNELGMSRVAYPFVS